MTRPFKDNPAQREAWKAVEEAIALHFPPEGARVAIKMIDNMLHSARLEAEIEGLQKMRKLVEEGQT